MKLALITAGHKGLGLGWSQALNSLGYKVIIASRKVSDAKQIINKLPNDGDSFIFAQLDVSNEESIKSLSKKIKSDFGRLDLLINNAGINPKDFDNEKKLKAFSIEHLDFEEMENVYRVNSLAPLIMVKHFMSLLENGESPKVINISSWLSSINNLSFGGHYGYVSSKNLLNILNKSLALEIKSKGIICINVNPGWVKTQMGGMKATFTPLESANKVIKNVIDQVSIEDTGKFFNFDGSIHPW